MRPPHVDYMMSRFPKLSETFIPYEMLAMRELGYGVSVNPLLREHDPLVHPDVARLADRLHRSCSDLHVDRHMLCEKVAEASFVVAVSDYNRRVIIEHCGDQYADKIVIIHSGGSRHLRAN
jgi:hypothetical protein